MPQNTTSQLVIALYDDLNTAEAAVKSLKQINELKSANVSLFTCVESEHSDQGQDRGSPSFLARLMGDRRTIADVRNALVKLEVADDDAQYFAEGLRRGNALVAVQASEATIQETRSVLESQHAINITERTEQWRKAGWTGFQPDAKLYTAQEAVEDRKLYTAQEAVEDRKQSMAAETRSKAGDEAVLPVMEEKLVVGKRDVEHGKVRVYTRVTETPVEESVNLREEHISVKRRPVDRPVNAGDLDAFKEKTIEVTERVEEAVVTKQARVVEEVIVHKGTTERTEIIHDTVRRTDVQVEDTRNIQPTAQRNDTDYTAYDPEFRTHYDSQFANSGYTYEQFVPAYRFGHILGTHERYRGSDWSAVEPDARRLWEERNQGTWENFKDAIRHAWVVRDRSATGPD